MTNQTTKRQLVFKEALLQRHVDKLIEQYNIYTIDQNQPRPLPVDKQQLSLLYQEIYNMQEKNKLPKIIEDEETHEQKEVEKSTKDKDKLNDLFKAFLTQNKNFKYCNLVKVENPCKVFKNYLADYISMQFKQEFTQDFISYALQSLQIQQPEDPTLENEYEFQYKYENHVPQNLQVALNQFEIYKKMYSIYNKIVKVEDYKKQIEATQPSERANIFLNAMNNAITFEKVQTRTIEKDGKKVKDKLTDDEKEINKKAIIGQDLHDYQQLFKSINNYQQYEYDEIKTTQYNYLLKELGMKLSKEELIHVASIKLNQILSRVQDKLQQLYNCRQGEISISQVTSSQKPQKEYNKNLLKQCKTDEEKEAQEKLNDKYDEQCKQQLEKVQQQFTSQFFSDNVRHAIIVGLAVQVVPKQAKQPRQHEEKISLKVNSLTQEQLEIVRQIQSQTH